MTIHKEIEQATVVMIGPCPGCKGKKRMEGSSQACEYCGGKGEKARKIPFSRFARAVSDYLGDME